MKKVFRSIIIAFGCFILASCSSLAPLASSQQQQGSTSMTLEEFLSMYGYTLNGEGSNNNGNGNSSNNPTGQHRTPVYQGMTVSRSSENKLNLRRLDDKDAAEDGHYGHEKDDYSDDIIENPIQNLVSLNVETDDEVKYYVQPNETFIIEVHISNPDNYEIQSFTLNGKKYANYMFEKGSNMELLLLQTTAPDTSGYFDYTIDAIKYLDGTEIKDVDMRTGNKKIRTGITYTEAPSAEMLYSNISTTYAEFTIDIIDNNGLIGTNDLNMFVTDGETICGTLPLQVGRNRVKFDNLKMSRAYQYGIVTQYDLVDGKDLHYEWLLIDEFDTLGAFAIKNVEAGKSSISFDVEKTGESGSIDSIKLYDKNTEELVAQISPNERVFENLLSNHEYALFVDYSYTVNGEEIHDWDSKTNLKTLEKNVPVLTFNNSSSDQTSISYQINVDDIDQTINVTKVELLKNEEVVAENGSTLEGSFNELLSNNNYSVRVTYTYDLNDGEGIHTGFITRDVTTRAKAVPTVVFDQSSTDQTSASFHISVADIDNVISIDKIELMRDGVLVEEKAPALEGTFTNLLSNNDYTIKITYTYNLNDGEGTHTDTITKDLKTVEKAKPVVEFANYSSDKTSVSYDVSVNDVDGILGVTSVELLKNGEPVQNNQGNLTGSFTGLLSDNLYSVKVTYTYDLNDGQGVQTDYIIREVTTVAKTKPVLKFDNSSSDKTTCNYEVSIEDVDGIIGVVKVELTKNGEVVANNGDLLNGSFTNLLSNNLYTVKVTYTYDLNDGQGVQEGIVTKDYLTSSKLIPQVAVINESSTPDSISFDIQTSDEDGILDIENAQLLDDGQPVQTITDLSNRTFTGLESGHKYTIAVNYKYDLNDGEGNHEEQATREYITLLDTISVSSISCLNTNVVKVGEAIKLSLMFNNHRGAILNSIYVNDQEVETDNTAPTTRAIVSMTPTETGLVSFYVNKVTYTLEGITVTQLMDNSVSATYPVYDELEEVEFIPVSTNLFESRYSQGVILHFNNRQNYDIEKINDGTPFTKLDKDTYYVRSNRINSIEYGFRVEEFAGLTTSQTFNNVWFNDENTFSQFKMVSTPEEFLSMTNGYYVLANDIELGEHKLTKQLPFSGILVGNGHVVRNFSQVVDTGNSEYYYPYDYNGARFYDVRFENTYISVSGSSDNSTSVYPFGYANLCNCYVGGDVICTGNAYYGNIYNVNSSTTIDLTYKKDENKSKIEFTGTRLEQNSTMTLEDGYLMFNYNGYKAVMGCFDDSITSYTSQEDEFYVGNGAFGTCDNLTQFTTNPNVYFGYNAISSSAELKSAVIPVSQLNSINKSELESITIIGEGNIPSWCFNGCAKLRNVTICDGITSISEYAFQGCVSLESVTIGNDVTSIEYSAFRNCSNLKSVSFGNSVSNINGYAFAYCRNLSSIELPESLKTIEYNAFNDCDALQTVVIPNQVEKIGDGAFQECNYLSSIYIPESVTNIGNYVFSGSYNLSYIFYKGSEDQWSSIEMGSSNYNLQSAAIEYETNVTGLTPVVTDKYSYILTSDGRAFGFKIIDKTITSFDFNEELPGIEIAEISNYAFQGCTSLTSITLPNNVERVGDYAFQGCTALETVNFNNKVTSIGSYAFEGCTSLKTIDLSGNISSIGDSAFSGCTALKSVTFGDEIVSIGSSAFSGCTALESATFGNKLTSIGHYAFSNCSSLESVTFGSGIQTIGHEAFSRCSSLESITFPASVTSINDYAFRECSSLKSVVFENSEATIGSGAFEYCRALETVNLGNKIASIGNNAFYDCETLKTIIIPDSVTYLGSSSFGSCGQLSSVVIGSGVTSIESNTFSWCGGLKTLVIGANVETIKDSAFYYCHSIQAIIVSNSLTSVGENAFYECNNIKHIFFTGAEEQWNAISFHKNGNDCIENNTNINFNSPIKTISFVQTDACSYILVDGYKAIDFRITDNSIAYFNFVEELQGVVLEEIASDAFNWCGSLTLIVLPEEVTSISENAFKDCGQLQYVYYAGSQEQWNAIDISETGNANLLNLNVEYESTMGFTVVKTATYSYILTDDKRVLGFRLLDSSIKFFNFAKELEGLNLETLLSCTFNNAYNVVAIVLPDTVKTISSNTFRNDSLKYVFYTGSQQQWNKISIGDNNNVLNKAYVEVNTPVNNLTYVSNNSYSYILTNDNRAFGLVVNDKTMTSFDFNDEALNSLTIVSLGRYAFANCSKLTTVILPEGLEMIDYGAFGSCESLVAITIPSSLKRVSENAFEMVYGLNYVFYEGTETEWNSISVENNWNDRFINSTRYYQFSLDSISYVSNDTLSYLLIDNQYVYGFKCLDTSITSFDFATALPNLTVVSLANGAFDNCSSLKTIILPSTLVSIPCNAFRCCSSLTAIVLSSSVKIVDSNAFEQCYDLNYVFYEGTETEWNSISVENNWNDRFINSTRYYQFSLDSISYVSNDTLSYLLIDNQYVYGFRYYDTSINTINLSTILPNLTVVDLSPSAFANCNSLLAIVLPESVTRVNRNAFEYCNSLSCIFYEGTETKWALITIESSWNERFRDAIKYYEFSSESISFVSEDSYSYLLIDNQYVYGFKCLDTSITSFDFATALPNLTIVSLANGAFTNCSSLQTIILPNTITSIPNYAFNNCSSLVAIVVPSTVKTVYSDAFEQVYNLKYVFFEGTETEWNSINIEDSWNGIFKDSTKYYQFTAESISFVSRENHSYILADNQYVYEYKQLDKSITSFDFATALPNLTVVSLANEAFRGCDSLSTIVIPNSVTRIGNYAFYECTYLSSVTLSSNLITIGDRAFCQCKILTSIIIPNTVKSIGNGAFADCFALTSIVIPDSVVSLGNEAFQQCTSLRIVHIGNGVSSIKEGTFRYCYAINTLIIGANVTTIERYAFEYCGAISTVVIPVCLESVGQNAFNSAGNVKTIFYSGNQAEWNNITVNPNGNELFVNNNATIEFESKTTSMEYVSTDKYSYYLTNDNRVFDFAIVDKTITSFDFATELPGLTIVSLANGAFQGCTALTSIVIPDSLTSLSDNVFEGCTSLMSVVFGNNLTRIGNYAFKGCSAIISIVIPESVTFIGYYAFSDCSRLVSITMSSNLTAIGYSAFNNCKRLKSIIIPEGVKIIEYGTFSNCQSLETITFVGNITAIEGGAFRDCSSLKNVTLPESLVSIGYEAFQGCSSLTTIIIPNSVTSIGNAAFRSCNSLISANIGKGVTTIESSTFEYCYALRIVTLGSNTTMIGSYAFNQCYSLYAIVIPNGLKLVDEYAFQNANTKFVFYNGTENEWNLINFDLNGNSIFDNASIEYESSSSSISLVSNDSHTYYLTNDGKVYNFAIVDKTITSFDFASALPGFTIVTLNDEAFRGCGSLVAITIPSSVEAISSLAFYGCNSLRHIFFDGTENEWNQTYHQVDEWNNPLSDTIKHFDFSSESMVYVANDLVSYILINNEYVYDFKCLDTSIVTFDFVSVLSGLTLISLADGAFANCSSLQYIALPDSLTEISENAFNGCSSLAVISIPKTISTVKSNAFANSGLTIVFFSGSKAQWNNINVDGYGNYVLDNSYLEENFNVTSFEIVENNLMKYILINNNRVYNLTLIDKTIKSFDFTNELPGMTIVSLSNGIFSGCLSLTSVVLPETLISIGNSMFEGCKSLTSIVVPNNVVSIGMNAFNGCTALESVTLGDKLTSIGDYAFEGCTSLKSINLSGNISSVGSYAFSGCLALETITLSEKLISIGSGSFQGCSMLSSVALPNSVTSIGDFAFKGCTSLTSINIPGSVASIGYNAFDGCVSLEIVTLSNGLTTIWDNAFYNCASLKSIVIPNSVTYIGGRAFYECSSLEKVILSNNLGNINYETFKGCSSLTFLSIPNSVTNIGRYAFDNCSNLSAINLGSGLTEIGEYAFSNCSSLMIIVIPRSLTYIGYSAFQDSYDIKFAFYSGTEAQWKLLNLDNYNNYNLKNCSNIEFNSAVTSASLVTNEICSYIKTSDNRVFDFVILDKTIESFDFATELAGLSVITLGSQAFYQCVDLTEIVLPDTLVLIGEQAFADCISLTSVTIPNSVKTISGNAFRQCSNIVAVNIGSGLTYIGYGAFYGCTSLAVITIPNTLSYVGGEAFNYDENLKYVFYSGTQAQWNAINVEYSNGYFRNRASIEYNCSITSASLVTNEICSYIKTSDNRVFDFVILDKTIESFDFATELAGLTLASIGDRAFYQCANLEEIILPDTLISIGNYAFYGCASLASITIPNGVTSIGEATFRGCKFLETITLSNSLVSIGDYAFYGCKSLTSITFNNNLTTIGGCAFYECISLTSIIIPNSVTSLGNDAFYKCSSLESVKLGNGLTEIKGNTFYNCSSLTSIVVPDSVIAIRGGAFDNCSNLRAVTLGKSVETLEWGVFQGCSSLKAVVIPRSLTFISNYAFSTGSIEYVFYEGTQKQWNVIEINSEGNNSLLNCNHFEFSSTTNNLSFVDNGRCSYIKTNDNRVLEFAIMDKTISSFDFDDELPGLKIVSFAKEAFRECSSLTSIVIPNDISQIDNYAFDGCSSLTNITLPNNLTSIGDYAFYNCSSLTSIVIPDSVTSIGYEAFRNCTSLTNVILSNNLASISNYAFYNCSALTSIVIPDSVTSIGYEAFYNCTSLTSVTLSNSITSINSGLFCGCEKLVSVTGGNNVTEIQNSAFSGCRKLDGFIIQGKVTSIGSCAFSGCQSLTSIVIPDSVISIGSSAFSGCKHLESITLGNSLQIISEYAFDSCSSLTSIVIPDSVTTIKNSAFQSCGKLRSVTIGRNVEQIQGWTFNGCGSLEVIYIPSSVESIGECAFQGCYDFKYVFYGGSQSQWSNIDIHENVNSNITSDSVKFEYNTNISSVIYVNTDSYSYYLTSDNRVFEFAVVDKTITSFDFADDLPGLTIVSIRAEAFRDCNALVSLIIPNSVTAIDYNTFYGCSALESITLSENIKEIGNYAFYSCSNLRVVVIPNGVTSIGYEAFSNCNKLYALIVPASLTSIGNNAFYGVGSIQYVYFTGSEEQWSAISIGYGNSRLTNSYRREYNNSFNSIELVENNAYSYLLVDGNKIYDFRIVDKNISSFDFADVLEEGLTLVTIGDYAFSNCQNLQSIVLPNTVVKIGDYAFSSCNSLVVIALPESLTSIGADIFNGAYSLNYIFYEGSEQQWNILGIYAYSALKQYNEQVSTISFVQTAEYSYFLINNKVYEFKVLDKTITSFDFANELPGQTIIALATEAFADCTALQSITLPDSIIYAGARAFNGCTALEEATIGSGFTLINDGTFSGCSSLQSITIPNSVTSINTSAFADCTSLTNVTFGNKITSIGNSAFNGCTALETITIPNTITYLGHGAFYNCTGLTQIVLSNRLQTIEGYAFYNCSSLTSIIIPDTVTYIGDSAFENCAALEKVTFGSGLQTIGSCAFKASGLKYVSLPNTITNIPYAIFQDCTALKAISIPTSVTNISWYAFDGCQIDYICYSGSQQQWNNMYISSQYNSGFTSALYRLYDTSFRDSFEFVNNMNYSYYLLDGQYVYGFAIKNVRITSFDFASELPGLTIKGIDNGAFSDCQSLTSIVIPDTIEIISERAFENCKALTSITIGSGVQTIDSYAFRNCDALVSIVIPDNVTTINYDAFESCDKLKNITLSNQLTYIGGNAFSNCNALEIIVIPDSVKTIEYSAFWYCNNLKYVILGNGLTSINNSVFQGCYSLTAIIIPTSVVEVKENAFNGDSNVQHIFYAGTEEQWFNIKFNSGNGEFLNSLYVIEYGSSVHEITKFTNDKCSYFVTNDNRVLGFKITDKTITSFDFVSEFSGLTVVGVSNEAFRECYSLTSITIPDSVVSIGSYAFSNCSQLSVVNLGTGIKSIGDYAFHYCSSLQTLTLPEGLVSIGRDAISGCSNLTSIVIPESVKSIGDYAFNGDYNLRSVEFKGTVPPTFGEYEIFGSVPENCTIIVPSGSLEAYQTALPNYSSKISEKN